MCIVCVPLLHFAQSTETGRKKKSNSVKKRRAWNQTSQLLQCLPFRASALSFANCALSFCSDAAISCKWTSLNPGLRQQASLASRPPPPLVITQRGLQQVSQGLSAICINLHVSGCSPRALWRNHVGTRRDHLLEFNIAQQKLLCEPLWRATILNQPISTAFFYYFATTVKSGALLKRCHNFARFCRLPLRSHFHKH